MVEIGARINHKCLCLFGGLRRATPRSAAIIALRLSPVAASAFMPQGMSSSWERGVQRPTVKQHLATWRPCGVVKPGKAPILGSAATPSGQRPYRAGNNVPASRIDLLMLG